VALRDRGTPPGPDWGRGNKRKLVDGLRLRCPVRRPAHPGAHGALDQWAYLHQVTLDFSRPGKPPTMRWWRKIEAWREHYNESRPHTSMGYVPPSVFAQQARRNAAHEPGLLAPELD
jgi:putative transposase